MRKALWRGGKVASMLTVFPIRSCCDSLVLLSTEPPRVITLYSTSTSPWYLSCVLHTKVYSLLIVKCKDIGLVVSFVTVYAICFPLASRPT